MNSDLCLKRMGVWRRDGGRQTKGVKRKRSERKGGDRKKGV